MEMFNCPHCGQAHFATVCSDCLSEAIPIQETRSVFHIGRCHRCGHVDDELCSARVGSSETVTHLPQDSVTALRSLTQKAVNLAARATDAITKHTDRPH